MKDKDKNNEVDHDLLAKYNNKANDYSFGSRKTVYKYFPHLKKKIIDKTLLKSPIITKYKKYKKPRKYLPVYGKLTCRNIEDLFLLFQFMRSENYFRWILFICRGIKRLTMGTNLFCP